jgi:hypothetical protein
VSKQKTLPFRLLYENSLFTIFSEPSRDIQRSNDSRTYRKECEAYSVQVDPSNGKPVEPEVVCILRPSDLVTPVQNPRGGNRRSTTKFN